MDSVQPAVANRLVDRLAGVFQPTAIVPSGVPCRIIAPEEFRPQVGHGPELLFTDTEGRFGCFAVCDVPDQTGQMHPVGAWIAAGGGAFLQPGDLAIARPDNAKFCMPAVTLRTGAHDECLVGGEI